MNNIHNAKVIIVTNFKNIIIYEYTYRDATNVFNGLALATSHGKLLTIESKP